MGPLIIGRVPEPNNIGGVGIFTSRLLLASRFLRSNDYDFYSTKNKKPIDLILRIYRSTFVHFNGSNELMMFAVAAICQLLRKKLILSIHGEVGLARGMRRLIEKWAIKLAYIPVVGESSFSKALRINKRSGKASAFLPPSDPFDGYVDSVIASIKDKKIFCTNANNFVFDSHGREIYGVLFLVKYFVNQNDSVLVIVDSSGAYSKHFSREKPPNVIFINQDLKLRIIKMITLASHPSTHDIEAMHSNRIAVKLMQTHNLKIEDILGRKDKEILDNYKKRWG